MSSKKEEAWRWQLKLRLDPSIFREHGAGIQPRSQTQHVEIALLVLVLSVYCFLTTPSRN